jgi:hypothetical protein
MAYPHRSMIPSDRAVQSFGDSWANMGWGRNRPDPYAPPGAPPPPPAPGQGLDFMGPLNPTLPPPPRLHAMRHIELPEHMRMNPPPRRGSPRYRGETPEWKKDLDKRDKEWAKKEKKLRKAQRAAQKELREAQKEMRTLMEDLESDLQGEPRRFRGPAGEQMYAPPPPPPMPRLLPEGHYPPPPPPMPRNLPEERLVPPGYQFRVGHGGALPEGVHQPPAPPASQLHPPRLNTHRAGDPQWRYSPHTIRRGGRINPWEGRRPVLPYPQSYYGQ